MNGKKVLLTQGPFRGYAEPHTFIIRIWQERSRDCGGETCWRGTIDHVGCNQNLHFIEGEGILRFIEEQTGIRMKRPTPWWRALFSRWRHEDR